MFAINEQQVRLLMDAADGKVAMTHDPEAGGYSVAAASHPGVRVRSLKQSLSGLKS